MSVVDSLSAVIDANCETIDQGLGFLLTIPDELYTVRSEPLVASSIGEHFRHIVDMYHAVMNGLPATLVDYNHRRRGALIESELTQALVELRGIKSWLEELSGNEDEQLRVVTEVALGHTQSLELTSSLVRELVFTSSHAVHHYALIAVIARIHGIEVDAELGVAAATASHQRTLAAAS